MLWKYDCKTPRKRFRISRTLPEMVVKRVGGRDNMGPATHLNVGQIITKGSVWLLPSSQDVMEIYVTVV